MLAKKAMRASIEIPALWRRLLVVFGLSVRTLSSVGHRFLERLGVSEWLSEVVELEEPEVDEELVLGLRSVLAGSSILLAGVALGRRPDRFRLSSRRISLASVPICSFFPIASVWSSGLGLRVVVVFACSGPHALSDTEGPRTGCPAGVASVHAEGDVEHGAEHLGGSHDEQNLTTTRESVGLGLEEARSPDPKGLPVSAGPKASGSTSLPNSASGLKSGISLAGGWNSFRHVQ